MIEDTKKERFGSGLNFWKSGSAFEIAPCADVPVVPWLSLSQHPFSWFSPGELLWLSVGVGVCHSDGAQCGPYDQSGASALIYNPDGATVPTLHVV